ncbi:hypothetical protein ACIA6T_07950 [Streptomyces sp. NPDC051740]|uniref:hypothetical protein n=1 Tax=Streptomyces sp. NPDC051740 TaxID=3365673 RepID=UPI0037B3F959
MDGYQMTERQAVYVAAQLQTMGTECVAMPEELPGGAWRVYSDTARTQDLSAEGVDAVAARYAFT